MKTLTFIFIGCLLFVGFKTCIEKDTLIAALVLVFAALYIGIKVGIWDEQRRRL